MAAVGLNVADLDQKMTRLVKYLYDKISCKLMDELQSGREQKASHSEMERMQYRMLEMESIINELTGSLEAR